jgi:plastocyanin
MQRSNTRRLMVIALVAGVGLTACGSDDDSSGSTPADTASADTAAAASVPATDAAPATEYVDEEYDVPDTVAATVAESVAESVAATDPPATDAPDDATTLTISEFTFSSPTVSAGTSFTITNEDGFAHTVTSRDDFFSVGVDGGASEPLTIEAPGTYEIFCRIHPSMEGTITVV